MNKELNNQYHSPVCAGLHVMLEAEEDSLIYQKEYLLGTGSKAIDCLIIKKEKAFQIKTDIGQIFRGHNLIEIKGYRDILSIDKYYKALGYALFYKADTGKENVIDIEDITLTFICTYMPVKLLKHIRRVWGIECVEKWEGIYYFIAYKDRTFIRRKREMVQVCEGLRDIIYEAAEEQAKIMAQGMAQDMAQDMAQEQIKENAAEKAKEMLKDGLSSEKVSKYSGLTLKEVENLQKRLLLSV